MPVGAVIIPVTLFILVAFVAFAYIHYRNQREARRIELHAKILDRIGSAREFGEFLGSDAGRRFLQYLAPESSRPAARLLWNLRTGTVLLVVGLGVFLGISVGAFNSEEADFRIIAVLTTAIGVGMVLASLISYVVAKRIGIVNGDRHELGANRTDVLRG